MIAWGELRLDDVMRLTSACAAVGIALNTSELLANWRANTTFFDWRILRTKYPALLRRPALGRIVDRLMSDRVFPVVLLLGAASALAVPFLIDRPAAALTCASVTLGVHLLTHFRLVYGMDGSDQMQTVVWGAIVVYLGAASEVGRTAAVWFLAAQLALSYMTSGIAKAISPLWRSGRAVAEVVGTASYGTRGFLDIVQRYRLSYALSWGTILFEVAGPLCITLGVGPTLAFLAAGVAFHVGIAAVMGLNSFVWAFLATYPAVLFVAASLRR